MTFRPPIVLTRAQYSEARQRWIRGEREALLTWLRVALGRPELALSSLHSYAKRQGWPRRFHAAGAA
jgi:hypothetical protein